MVAAETYALNKYRLGLERFIYPFSRLVCTFEIGHVVDGDMTAFGRKLFCHQSPQSS